MSGVKAFAEVVNYASRKLWDPGLASLYIHYGNVLRCEQTADLPTSIGNQLKVNPSKSEVKTGGNNAGEGVRRFNKASVTSTTGASFAGEGGASSLVRDLPRSNAFRQN